MNHNAVLSLKDYEALGVTRRKQWEVQKAMRALNDLADLSPDDRILIPGAGFEPTIYILSNMVKEVVALDLYQDPGMWHTHAPTEMFSNPGKFAPEGMGFDVTHISVVHGDMCDMSQYKDGEFDAICSLGSIEHVGTWEDVSRAAAEIGRVLKPGGIAAIATEYRIDGLGQGWPGVLVFNEQEMIDLIVKPSGLEMVDELRIDLDEATLKTSYPLRVIVESGGVRPNPEAVLHDNGYTFTSVMLVLRKPKPVTKRRKKTTATIIEE